MAVFDSPLEFDLFALSRTFASQNDDFLSRIAVVPAAFPAARYGWTLVVSTAAHISPGPPFKMGRDPHSSCYAILRR